MTSTISIPHELDPLGRMHIAIGVANTMDTLKTYVEAEGNFSPGFASYGIYFWIFDPQSQQLIAPTMPDVVVEHGLNNGLLMPWASWHAADVEVRSEVCAVQRDSPAGPLFVSAARVTLHNISDQAKELALYVAVRPLGAAGWPIHKMEVERDGKVLCVDGHPAILASQQPQAAGVMEHDEIGQAAALGEMPATQSAVSPDGTCSGALRYALTLQAGETQTFGFICPVLPGRRAVGHQWDGVSPWAQLDLANPNPEDGGALQPDPGSDYYLQLSPDVIFDEATTYNAGLTQNIEIRVPDARWADCFRALVGHVALAMNEGAPDVTAINYNVFNRDGIYVTSILQKAGRFDLAGEAIKYFLEHPFNGRVEPEADNPGQVLWVLGEQWRFTRDRAWLGSIYPAVRQLASMIRYYRTTPSPHWVHSRSLLFGDVLPVEQREELRPGSCDGFHPEYTEAFDLAGLRAAIELAQAQGEDADAGAWQELAGELLSIYDRKFGNQLGHEYGSYCVQWPCRLYPLQEGKAFEQFNNLGAQQPTGWRYFPLATAHQSLLCGNREAGYRTLEMHLQHEQMQGWYAFDEGGDSGPGNWPKVLSRWNPSIAMPHGWAIAEVQLLLRDSLLFEDDQRLVLLGGIPPSWFQDATGIHFSHLPTYFGECSLSYSLTNDGALLQLSGSAQPPDGYLLRLPSTLSVQASIAQEVLPRAANGDILLPPGTREVRLLFLV